MGEGARRDLLLPLHHIAPLEEVDRLGGSELTDVGHFERSQLVGKALELLLLMDELGSLVSLFRGHQGEQTF